MNEKWTPPNFDRMHGPPVCIGRYAKHLSGWTDEHGINRCWRCHAALPPKGQRAAYEAYAPNKQKWSDYRTPRHEQTEAQREAAKPRTPAHNTKCPHPPPISDPMAAHEDAQRRMWAWEKQRKCEICGDWLWEKLFTNAKGESDGSQEGRFHPPHSPPNAPEAPDGVQTPPNA